MKTNKSPLRFFQEHQTISSVLAIIISVMTLNSWMTADIRADTRETNKRIDALFQFVLTKEVKK